MNEEIIMASFFRRKEQIFKDFNLINEEIIMAIVFSLMNDGAFP